MTSSSSYNNRSSAALFLIALLFSASTPPPVHAQLVGGLPVPLTNTIPLIFSLLSNLGPGNLLSQINNINPIILRILRSVFPVTLNVVGQVTCPGLGTGVPGLPVILSCVTNGNRTLGSQSVTNSNGSFTVSATLLPIDAVRLIAGILPNNTLTCLISTRRQLVQSVISCPALTSTTSDVLSLVQLTQPTLFFLFRRILRANATASATA